MVGTYVHQDQHAELDYVNATLTLRTKSSIHQVRQNSRTGQWLVDDVLGSGPKIEFVHDGQLRIDNQLFDRAPEKRPAAVKPEWQELIGEYGWDHDVLFVLEDHGQLVALIEWFYAYPLKQVGPMNSHSPTQVFITASV